ncbi:MAG: TetR/AcrR family transcriptional regulator [Polyangiaceae bacterium]
MEKRSVRDGIVEAALALVSRTGPALLSMRDVAQRAGVSVGTVSYHFSDKNLLLEAVLDEYYRELDSFWSHVAANVAGQAITREQARQIIGELFALLRRQRNLTRLRIMLSVQTGTITEARLNEHLIRYAEALQRSFPHYTLAELRLRMYSVFLLTARYAAMHMDEWKSITQQSTAEGASDAVKALLLEMAVDLMQIPAEPAAESDSATTRVRL